MRASLCSAVVRILAAAALMTAASSISSAAQGPRAGPPQDYARVAGLSRPRFETVRSRHLVEGKDGVELYVEVVRPKAAGRYPVILELSPYHGTLTGRRGIGILPGPKRKGRPMGLTGYFAPRGYAVVMADLRGTGRSQGCLDLLGKNDASDAKVLVEWAGTQRWSNGRVGMTGHSYVASTATLAAAQRPRHLETIVASAGLAAMYDHQFQLGVPYFLQWAGPLHDYQLLAMERHLPVAPYGDRAGDNLGNDAHYFGCGWQNSAAMTGESLLSGAQTEWHRQRDWSRKARRADIPVFLVHGVNDAAARIAAIDWFNRRRRPGDKSWIGQWDHGSMGYPNNRTCSVRSRRRCDDDQWTLALHAWFDRHLKRRAVDTGPPVEVFLNDGRVLTAPAWPPRTNRLTLFAARPDALLDTHTAKADSVVYMADGRGSYPLRDEDGTGHVAFETARFERDALIVGVPRMRLTTSVTSPRTYINAQLYEVAGRRIDRIGQANFAVQPELRNGIAKPRPVVPGQKMTLRLKGMAMAHLVEAGSKLRLIVASSHPDKVPVHSDGSFVRIFVGGKSATKLSLPVIFEPTLWPDPLPGGRR